EVDRAPEPEPVPGDLRGTLLASLAPASRPCAPGAGRLPFAGAVLRLGDPVCAEGAAVPARTVPAAVDECTAARGAGAAAEACPAELLEGREQTRGRVGSDRRQSLALVRPRAEAPASAGPLEHRRNPVLTRELVQAARRLVLVVCVEDPVEPGPQRADAVDVRFAESLPARGQPVPLEPGANVLQALDQIGLRLELVPGVDQVDRQRQSRAARLVSCQGHFGTR